MITFALIMYLILVRNNVHDRFWQALRIPLQRRRPDVAVWSKRRSQCSVTHQILRILSEVIYPFTMVGTSSVVNHDGA